MTYLDDSLSAVRAHIDASAGPLAVARSRLDDSLKAASSFPGALRPYRSGSIAQKTIISPVSDGDGGVVLNRQVYTSLGPDGANKPPTEVTDQLIEHMKSKMLDDYPSLTFHRSKRGPLLRFHDPVDGDDPTVDVVVALNRRDGNGLWIPNLDTETWEASDPEGHVTLFNTAESLSLLAKRRKAVRLSKAWNKQYFQPAFTSFMLSVFGESHVTSGSSTAQALLDLMTGGAAQLGEESVPDPVGVSADLKMKNGTMANGKSRMDKFATNFAPAVQSPDDKGVVDIAMASVFWNHVSEASLSASAATVLRLSKSASLSTASFGFSGPPAAVEKTRAYGDAS